MSRHAETDYLGVGLYTVAEASRLTRVNPTRIRRWVSGYNYRVDREYHSQSPVWRLRIPEVDKAMALSFDDLMEVRFVSAFRDAGISLPKIRFAVSELKRMLRADYPFSTKKVVTDGIHLFTEILDDEGKSIFNELSRRRHFALRTVIESVATEGIIFGNDGRISRWYPDKDINDKIVIDPVVEFGHPVIDRTRIRVKIIGEAVKAEGSAERVSEWYEIPIHLVKQAVDFHNRFLA